MWGYPAVRESVRGDRRRFVLPYHLLSNCRCSEQAGVQVILATIE